MKLWPHQERALESIPKALEEHQRVLVVAPTGAGKSRVMFELIKKWRSVSIYTDRRALLDQLAENMEAEGISYGYRASGQPTNKYADVQLCMVQTEHSRVVKNKSREHTKSRFIMLDEAHRLSASMMSALLALHKEDGAKILGFTATPTDLEGYYDEMIILATNKECRKCGAHVPCVTYAPFTVSTKHLKPQSSGEYSPSELEKTFARPDVFAPALYHYQTIAQGKPTILFGPDVGGALWYCEQFNAHDIPAGHIDGDKVIIKNDIYEADADSRRMLFNALRKGEIKLVTTRFVMREGIDLPFVSCLILATKFGGITTYLQSVGRGMRSAPGKEDCIILDIGGNYDLHGSPNEDRHWVLGETDREIVAKRVCQMREKDKPDSVPEPIVCPKCYMQRKYGSQCPGCGHVSHKKSRSVIEMDGRLHLVRGDIYKPRSQSQNKSEEHEWESMYYRAKRANMTFSQAEALFAKEHGWKYPNREWRLMPTYASEFALKVKDVPLDRLTAEKGLFQ